MSIWNTGTTIRFKYSLTMTRIMFYVKSVMGNLSLEDFGGNRQIDLKLENKKLDFKIFDHKMFN